MLHQESGVVYQIQRWASKHRLLLAGSCDVVPAASLAKCCINIKSSHKQMVAQVCLLLYGPSHVVPTALFAKQASAFSVHVDTLQGSSIYLDSKQSSLTLLAPDTGRHAA